MGILVALYDWALDLPDEALLPLLTEKLSALSIEWNTIIYRYASSKSERYGDLKSLMKGVRGGKNLCWVNFYNTTKSRDLTTSNFLLSVAYGEGDARSNEKLLSFYHDQLSEILRPAELENFILELSSELEAPYGYSIECDDCNEAEGHPLAVRGDPSYFDERRRLHEWIMERHHAKRHKDYMIRSVYPVNILSRSHLNHNLNGQTLETWIRSNSQNGELLSKDDAFIWKVSVDQIPRIGEFLLRNAVIVSPATTGVSGEPLN